MGTMMWRKRWWPLPLLPWLAALPVGLAAGCFGPDYGDGGAACVASHECPSQYVCNPENEGINLCRPANTRPPAITNFVVTPTTFKLPAKLTFNMLVENYALNTIVNQPAEAHFGHYHVILDPSDSQIYSPVHTDTATLTVDPNDPASFMFKYTKLGPVRVKAYLATYNHQPLSPPVEVTVTLTITP